MTFADAKQAAYDELFEILSKGGATQVWSNMPRWRQAAGINYVSSAAVVVPRVVSSPRLRATLFAFAVSS